MSRKSAVALAIAPVTPARKMEPPAGMTDEQRELWQAIFDSKERKFFDLGNAPLLAEYVRAVTMCNRLEQDIQGWSERGFKLDALGALLKARDIESKRVASLGTKLRLTQQSRYTPQAAATADKRAAGSRPWEKGA